jgi:hypothetical protein
MNPRLLQIFPRAYRDLRPRAPIPEFRAEFFPFANINNTIRMREGRLLARISDLLEGAPDDVLYAIAHILLAKLYRKPMDAACAHRYRQHISRKDVSAMTHRVRQLRGRKQFQTAQGQVYDLDAVFDELNTRFFDGLLARPRMTWSREHARNALGHYDSAHNAIVVSRVFDRPQVPRYAIEYLVYHEMLHLKHPVRLRGTRRCVHPREFHADEKLFPQLAEAKRFLKTL